MTPVTQASRLGSIDRLRGAVMVLIEHVREFFYLHLQVGDPMVIASTPTVLQIAEHGYLREGYWADLVLIGDRDFAAPDDPILSPCGWSPFAGRCFRSRVCATVVSGQLVYRAGAIDWCHRGQPLVFNRAAPA